MESETTSRHRKRRTRLPRTFAECLARWDDRAADWQWCRVERGRARYARSLASGQSPPRSDGDTDLQAENYVRSFRHQRAIEQLVNELLDARGARTILRVPCYAYARRLDKYHRHHGEETLRRLVAITFGEAQARGLDPEMLRVLTERVCGVRLE